MGNILSVQKVQKYYGNKASLTRALDVISFDVEQGEFLAIMGASGSGKTTLLNCISTIDKVTAGHIFVAGKDITGLKGKELNRFRRQELGFIFQDFNLLDTLTAYENIALALSIQKTPVREMEERIRQAAQELGYVKPQRKNIQKNVSNESRKYCVGIAQMAVQETPEEWYCMVLKNAVEQACFARNLETVPLFLAEGLSAKEIGRELQGIIAIGVFPEYMIEQLRTYTENIVFLGDGPDDSKYYSVVPHHTLAIELALNHLLVNGHRKIAFIGSKNKKEAALFEMQMFAFLHAMSCKGEVGSIVEYGGSQEEVKSSLKDMCERIQPTALLWGCVYTAGNGHFHTRGYECCGLQHDQTAGLLRYSPNSSTDHASGNGRSGIVLAGANVGWR